MDDEIIIERIEIIQDGLLQFDFHNTTQNEHFQNEHFRCLVNPKVFFGMLGTAMQTNLNKWIENHE